MESVPLDLVGFCEETLVDGFAASEPVPAYSSSPHYRQNAILQQSFEFAVAVLRYTDRLGLQRRWLVDQIQRSGCSIGANVKEAQNAGSLRDFVHKMKIALKEADETEYWYHLIAASHDPGVDQELVQRLENILRILNKIISTAKKRLEQDIR